MKLTPAAVRPLSPGAPSHFAGRLAASGGFSRARRIAAFVLATAAVIVATTSCVSISTRNPRPPELAGFRRPTAARHPSDNRYSDAKAELGRRLFTEPGLSANGTVSCASCHDPKRDFQDGRRFPVGIVEPSASAAKRRTPTLWNVGEHRRFFWDGRAASLEEQALKPIENPVEMGNSSAAVAERLRADKTWRAAFAAVFPDDPSVTPQNIARALATFQRTLTSPPSAFDRWVEGDDTAMSDAARRGFTLFQGKASCVRCHTGWAFTDGKLHDVGLAVAPADQGRVRFKTPTLRELSGRAPFMHDGSLADLPAVIHHYEIDRQRRILAFGRFSLGPTERDDLVQFLLSLDSRSQP